MPIKMIALDLDGTTLDSEGHITDYTKRVLEDVIQKGVHVVISTGRVYTAIPKEVLEIRGISYIITSNGAVIRDAESGEVFYGNYLSKSAINGAIELAKLEDLRLEAFWDGRAFIDRKLYEHIELNGLENRNADYVLSTRTPIDNLYDQMLMNSDRIENINVFFSSIDRLEAVRPHLQALSEATITSAFRYNIEIGGPTTSKRDALEVLLARLGISTDELMCCGDAPNDIEMIKLAGLGVAMGNAWGNTKDFADYITASNDEDGVAMAIEKFVL